MSVSVFLPITKKSGDELKLMVDGKELTVTPDAITYEKVLVSEFTEKDTNIKSKQETYYDKDGNEVKEKPDNDEYIFRLRMVTARANIDDIINNFKDDTFFVKKSTEEDGYSRDYYGGRKRKQSKYSSKKRSVKSRRSRNSRKRRYSRRR